MKTLYESILDDDDILIGNIKKDTDNPFLLLSLLSTYPSPYIKLYYFHVFFSNKKGSLK